jgi:Holliday junction DNA helicase RuvA
MIARLTGQPIIDQESLIMDVNGVGYAVAVTHSVLAKLSDKNLVSIFIYTHISDKAVELFGFLETADKKLFELLLTVSGVGPKTALNISESGAQNITQAVQQADVQFFTKTPRVGKKLAQKIIIELKSKLGSLRELELGSITDPKQKEVYDALLALGFEEQEALVRLKLLDFSQPLEVLIKQALKYHQ